MHRKIVLLFVCQLVFTDLLAQEKLKWYEPEKGFQYLEVKAPTASGYGDSSISVLRVDPHLFSMKLISAKELNTDPKMAPEWAKDHGLLGVFNAGMYLSDHQTNRDYMKNYEFINNPNMTSDNAVVAFNPIDDDLPPFQIIDLKCEDWNTLKMQYHTLFQGIRMVDCNGKNRWSDQPKMWSMIMIAEDIDGNALFIFTRSPHKVHDFINMVLKLDLNIVNAMYLEGGPEASFYINHPNLKVEKMGSYETGFWEDDSNNRFWDIPNIIGLYKKE